MNDDLAAIKIIPKTLKIAPKWRIRENALTNHTAQGVKETGKKAKRRLFLLKWID